MAENSVQDAAAMIKGKTKDNATEYTVVAYFDIIDDESCSVEASITDNFVESNYSLQDHIAIKPRIYRLRGYIGEAVYRGEDIGWDDLIGEIDGKSHPILKNTLDKTRAFANSSNVSTLKTGLTTASAISPIVGSYTQAAININSQLKSSYSRYKQIYKNITGKSSKIQGKRQQAAVSLLNRLLETRTPVSLNLLKFNEDPFNFIIDSNKLYFLQSVTAKQGDNAFITDIEITIKELRIATTETTTVDKSKYGQITTPMVQKAPEVNNGVAQGQTVDGTKAISNAVDKKIKDTVKTVVGSDGLISKVCRGIMQGIELTGKSMMMR